VGLFRPLKCLFGLHPRLWPLLCAMIDCKGFGPSPSSILFLTQTNSNSKPNISESRNQLYQHSHSQICFFFFTYRSQWPYQAFSKLSWLLTMTSRHFWYYLKQFHQNNVKLSVPFIIKARKVCYCYLREIKQTNLYFILVYSACNTP